MMAKASSKCFGRTSRHEETIEEAEDLMNELVVPTEDLSYFGFGVEGWLVCSEGAECPLREFHDGVANHASHGVMGPESIVLTHRLLGPVKKGLSALVQAEEFRVCS